MTADADALGSIRVLVVDSDHSLRESCAGLLRSQGFEVTVCGRGDDAVRLLGRRSFDILLVDPYLPRVSGLEVLETAMKTNPDSLAIVMTGDPSVESSVTALRAGAWDYLPKPFSAKHFDVLLGRAAHVVMEREREPRRSSINQDGSLGPPDSKVPLYGASEAIKHVIKLADKVAGTDASVFLTGESGSGKEVVAQYIHHNSRRSGGTLVAVNCAAIPEPLLESEMFGHVEGAFTGAVRAKEGLLEAADGGTLFLDELTELPLATQAKLLRVLQDGVVRRVGSTKTDAVVDVRFIAAMSQDPLEAVAQGSLRRDLLYRLRVVPIHIPPLRERPADISLFTEKFLKEFWQQHRKASERMPTISKRAMATLRQAPWPGNVRELRNLIEHLVVLAEPGGEVEPEDIVTIGEFESGQPGISASITGMDYHTAREHVLSGFEKEYLTRIVRESGGNVSDAARVAGVDRTTLYRLMEKHGLRRGEISSQTSG